MFKCLYCVNISLLQKEKVIMRDVITRRLCQNIINGDINADFDIIAYEGCILNEEENNPHIVNEDLAYVHMQ